MAQPGTPSRIVLALLWLVLGSAMVAIPAWLGWTSWAVILNGHPVMLVVAMVCALLGVVAVVWAVATLVIGGRQDRGGTPDSPRHRTRGQLRRRARARISLAVPALAIAALMAGSLAYAKPLAASSAAVAALPSSADVRYADRLTWYELAPTRKNSAGAPIRPTTGLVFYPGARVDARAYAKILRALARSGYLVIVLKEPFGFALTAPNQAKSPIEVHPEIRYWAVGGHSLGGTAASSFANISGEVKGLLLWASYPAARVTRTDLTITSIFGSADGVVTPADIAANRDKLPKRTSYVGVRGASHASFGDYGEQPGDGTPTLPTAVAQAQIVQASATLLAALTPRPRRR
jgi:hypothetical protein